MRTQIAAVADFSSITREGKLNVLGIFGQILALDVPAIHNAMSVVFQIEYEADEKGMRNLDFKLVDQDHRQLVGITGKIEFPPLADGMIDGNFPLKIDLNQTVFPEFGEYQFVLSIDDDVHVAKIPFRVAKVSSGV